MKGIPEQEVTSLCVKNVSVNCGKASLLSDVSMEVKSGCLLAIMGPSGAGKTTLLDAISGRVTLSGGKITLSGQPFDKQQMRYLGYLPQEDCFFSSLTLWETLYFTAMIRLPAAMPHADKLAKIEAIMETMELTKSRNTVIGNLATRGLSGGEKKRTSIACELLRDPDVLLLDEPTSGLDSSTAYSIVREVQKLGKQTNKIIVMTVHQPSSQMYFLFESLVLLAHGQVLYFGEAREQPLTYFETLGHVCKAQFNPADFLMELVKTKQLKSINHVVDCNAKSCTSAPELQVVTEGSYKTKSINNHGSRSKWPTGFWTQTRMLTWRSYREGRGRFLQNFVLVQYVLVTILMGLIFYQIPNNISVFRDKIGLLFFCTGHSSLINLQDSVLAFCSERDVIKKERATGAYRLSAFMMAKNVSEFPLNVVLATGLYTFSYWMAGLNGIPEFFTSWAVLLVNLIAAQSVAQLIGASIQKTNVAIITSLTYFIFNILLSGFVTQNLPPWLDWLKYMAMLFHAISAMANIVLPGPEKTSCNATSAMIYTSCTNRTSEYISISDILHESGMDLPIYCNVATLIITALITQMLAYTALRCIRTVRN